jgi:hypothetical protein
MTPKRQPDMTAARAARIEKHLNTTIRFRGEFIPCRVWLERLAALGGKLRTRQVLKIKDMTRTAFNRASQREQDDHARQQKEAGKKDSLEILLPDGIFFEVGKIEADYFSSLMTTLQPWHVEAARAVLYRRLDGDPDITDSHVLAANAVLTAAKDTDK